METFGHLRYGSDFQNAIRETLEVIDGPINIDHILVFSDFLQVKSSNTCISCIKIMYIDILVSDKNQEKHNLNLKAVFKRPREKIPSIKASASRARRSRNSLSMFSLTMAYRPTLSKWKVWSILKHQPDRLSYLVW